MSGRPAGKVALSTGTAGGQGRAAALLFAAEGATVVGTDIHRDGAAGTVELVRAAGGVMDSTSPLGLVSELGTPEEVARCALILASDEASYVTGADLVVDGGWSAVLPGDW